MCGKLVFIFVILSCIFAETDISSCNTKCYQTVNNAYENLLRLIDRLNSTASQAEIPKLYDIENFNNALADVNNTEIKTGRRLENAANGLNPIEDSTSKTQRIVDRLLKLAANISEYNDNVKNILNEAKKQQDQLKPLLENVPKCKQAYDKYKEFKKIIDGLIRDYEDLSKQYNRVNNETNAINKDIKNTFEKTVEIKNKFDSLSLPTNLVDDYLLQVERNFNASINKLKENADLLKELLRDSQKKWNNEIEAIAKNISQILDDLSKMNEELKNYEQAFEKIDRFKPTVTNESRKLLQRIKSKLSKFEDIFSKIRFTKEEKALLRNNIDDERDLAQIRKKMLIIKEYNIILDSLMSVDHQKIKDITKQIKNLTRLIKNWKKLDGELSELTARRDAIKKINCTKTDNSTIFT